MPAQSVRGARSPLWMRELSDPPGAEPPPAACADLKQALAALGARRLVVGHTVQPEINEACDGSVVRIDVGLSAAMLGAPPRRRRTRAAAVPRECVRSRSRRLDGWRVLVAHQQARRRRSESPRWHCLRLIIKHYSYDEIAAE